MIVERQIVHPFTFSQIKMVRTTSAQFNKAADQAKTLKDASNTEMLEVSVITGDIEYGMLIKPAPVILPLQDRQGRERGTGWCLQPNGECYHQHPLSFESSTELITDVNRLKSKKPNTQHGQRRRNPASRHRLLRPSTSNMLPNL